MSKPHQPRVLVVDDEEDACSNLSDILTDLGYHVDWADNGEDALELVRRTSYDVALLDLRMPGMDGLTLYREIKKIRAGTVAILVTAYADGPTFEAALTAGAWRVVPKPVHMPKLLQLVELAREQPTVLIVDDDREVCANLWEILREEGYRVALAHDPAEAVEQLKDATYQVALIDMKLPGGDGSTVFDLVRESDPSTRIILVTGCRPEMDDLVQRVLAEGADAAFYKPFDVRRLLDLLDRLAKASG